MMENLLEVDNIHCRSQQKKILTSLMGEKYHYTVPCLFIFGHTATGKTLVLESIMKEQKLPCVIANMVEMHSSKLLFEHILNGASNTQPDVENDFSQYARCDNMNDFIRLLRGALDDQGLDETFYVILDKAERLCQMTANLLPGLLRLQELTDRNVCVILVTELVWEKFRFGTGFLEPYVIHFSDYTKEELLEIMSLDSPEEYPVAFYKNYCNLLLSIFHHVCRNLNELRHLALLNFPKYVEPIKDGDVTINNTTKLWRNIEPHLRKALQTVYLREVSSSQWEKIQKNLASDENKLTSLHQASRVHLELPFYSKYLLIAAYLASYNPSKSDKRFFTKGKANVGKRSKLAAMKKHDRTTNQMLGPKPFPMDRLLAIFYAILDGGVAPTANIFSQISSLVTLGFLTQLASTDQLEMPKYKCLVSLEFIKTVSRTVRFEIVQYLFDFV